jgi:hypothetical protein
MLRKAPSLEELESGGTTPLINSGTVGGEWFSFTSRLIYLREKTIGTLWTEDWVGPRADLDGRCGEGTDLLPGLYIVEFRPKTL